MTADKLQVYIETAGGFPRQASSEAAGLDIRAAEDTVLLPGQVKLVKTGIKLAIPAGYEAQVRPRSGLSLKTNLRISNSPGTIDADYRDELGLIVENRFQTSDLIDLLVSKPDLLEKLKTEYRPVDYRTYLDLKDLAELGENLPAAYQKLAIYLDDQDNPFGSIYIKAGDRIAQLVFARFCPVDFIPCRDVSKIGQNRQGGYGSTGIL